MLKISNSLDWAQTDTELQKLGKMLPMFQHDIKRLSNNIQIQVSELSKLELKARTTHSRSVLEACERKVEEINAELKQIEKFHLMSLLSRTS
jgi:predicted metalloenzyme YecM